MVWYGRMALLYGHAGRLTAPNGGFRPGQSLGSACDILLRMEEECVEALAELQAGPAPAAPAVILTLPPCFLHG